MDFIRDYAEILRQRLDASGYSLVAAESDEDSIVRYLNVLNRKVEPRARQTKKVAEFVCPQAVTDGLRMLLQKSEAGGDLRPYQSLSIDKTDYDDGMLNDWGIQHFHLGTGPYPKAPQFMNRTGHLLYTVVTTDALYCLAVMRHQEWSNQKLLDVMYENFPEVAGGASLTNHSFRPTGLSVNYSDEDVAKLRAAGINVVTQRSDGRVMFGPGGGATLDRRGGRKSAKVARAVIDLRTEIQTIEDTVRQKIDAIKLRSMDTEVDVRLTDTGGELMAVDSTGCLRVRIDRPLMRPV